MRTPRTERAMRPAGEAYDRTRDLPRLIPVWPDELSDRSVAGAEALVSRIVRALRAERRRGLAAEWSYDLGRHRSLLLALADERIRLDDLQAAARRLAHASRRREPVSGAPAHI